MIVVDRLGNVQTNGEGQNNLLKKLYGTFLGRCALKILVCKFVSDLGGWYMNSSLSKRRIAPFIKENKIDMSQYEQREFKSYNDFFTRKIVDSMSSFISFAASALRCAKLRTSLATTEKPRPCSPALAASTAALSANILV